MWPFRSETRSKPDATGDLTERALALMVDSATFGRDPRTAAVEAAASLYGRCLAAATVAPDTGALMAVTPGLLAWAGRRLALRGEALLAIMVEGGALQLLPAFSHTVTGRDPDPESWRYRLDLPAPDGTLSRTVAAAGVVHLRWQTATGEPWRGLSPLEGAGLSADLHEKAVRSLRDEAGRASGALMPIMSERQDPDQFIEFRRELLENLRAMRGKLAVVPGIGTPDAPLRDTWQPRRYGPEPTQHQNEMARDSASAILSACGVPPGLFAESADGTGQREAWRRFWIGSVAPLGRMIEAELRAKLDRSATVAFEALRASDEDGRSRAVSRRAAAAKTFADMGLDRAEALRLAGLA